MSTYKSLMTLLGVAVLAFGLAACGGSSKHCHDAARPGAACPCQTQSPHQALRDAATCTDATQACVDAHQALSSTLWRLTTQRLQLTLSTRRKQALCNRAGGEGRSRCRQRRSRGRAPSSCRRCHVHRRHRRLVSTAHQALVDALGRLTTTTTVTDDLATAQANLATVQHGQVRCRCRSRSRGRAPGS